MKRKKRETAICKTRRLVLTCFFVLSITALCTAGCVSEKMDGVSESTLGMSESAESFLNSLSEQDPLKMGYDHISENDIGHFNIDADVTLPEKWNPLSYEVDYVSFADAVTDEYKNYLGTSAYLQNESTENGYKYVCYMDKAENYLVGDGGGIGFMNQNTDNGVGGFIYQPHTTLKAPYEDKELKDFSKKMAINSLKKMLRSFSIELSDNYTIFAATKEALNESAQNLAKDLDEGEMGFDKEALSYVYKTSDEFYVVFAPQILEGMPIAMNGYGTGSENMMGTLIKAEIGRKGIQSLNVDGYLKTIEPINDSRVDAGILPISLGDALKALNAKYEQVITTDRITIDRIALEYSPTYDKDLKSGMKIVPTWTFRDADLPDVSYRVNAITGELII